VRVRLRLFANLRQQAGWREQDFELPAGATIEDAWQLLAGAHPAVAASRDYVRFARNGRYVAAEQALEDGDELALIPPVAGG
jgi:sulfur-carrier protein